MLPWALLIIGAAASLAANITVAEPTLLGRMIAAWPSFALTASYELLMRQVCHAAQRAAVAADEAEHPVWAECVTPVDMSAQHPGASLAGSAEPVPAPTGDEPGMRRVVQRRAWQWALANRRSDGSLPAGTEVARQFGRSDRWGRLVTCLGRAGQLTATPETVIPT